MLAAAPTIERIALNRTTFGARDIDVDSVQRIGWTAWVKDQLNPPAGDDPTLASYLSAQRMHIEYPAYDNSPYYSWPAVNEDRPLQYLAMSATQIWVKSHKVYPANDHRELARGFDELSAALVIRNTHSRYQLREVMTDFWLNHFSISKAKDYHLQNMLIAFDRDVIRPNVFGNFRKMLEAVATSAAMLKYLDNADSQADQPNENYARELMELHTLGRGVYLGKLTGNTDLSAKGFTDDDIIQASRAFSGWTIAQNQYNLESHRDTGEFVFNPAQHNDTAGRCLGFDLATLKGQGLAQGRKVLDLVAQHPATANFVCTKLCRRLFGDAPPAAVIERAVTAWKMYADSPVQLKRVMYAILIGGPEIGQGPCEKVRRPHERIVALARTIDGLVRADPLWSSLLRGASDAPFGWLTPDGRPDTNEFWLSAAMNIEIWSQLRYLGGNSNYLSADIVAQTPENALKSPTLFVEYWVGRMVGYTLSAGAMAALVSATAKIMGDLVNNPSYRNNYFLGDIVAMIASTPEFVNR